MLTGFFSLYCCGYSCVVTPKYFAIISRTMACFVHHSDVTIRLKSMECLSMLKSTLQPIIPPLISNMPVENLPNEGSADALSVSLMISDTLPSSSWALNSASHNDDVRIRKVLVDDSGNSDCQPKRQKLAVDTCSTMVDIIAASPEPLSMPVPQQTFKPDNASGNVNVAACGGFEPRSKPLFEGFSQKSAIEPPVPTPDVTEVTIKQHGHEDDESDTILFPSINIDDEMDSD